MKTTSMRLRRTIGIGLAALTLAASLATAAPADAAKGGNGGGSWHSPNYYICTEYDFATDQWYVFHVPSRQAARDYEATHPNTYCYRSI